MIRINLLPYRAARKKENIRYQVNIFLLSVVLVGLLVFLYNAKLNGNIDELNLAIKNTKEQVAKYEKINKEIAEIKKKLTNLQKKMAVMDTLEANRFAPTRLLDTMTQVIVPKRMWFTGMESKDNTVKITGIALDNKTVADFMVRLEQSGLFKEVDLKTLKRKTVQKQNFKSFQIICTKKPPTTTEEPANPGKAEAKK